MSRKAFDKADKDVADAKDAVKLLLRDRHSLMETLVKDLPPREAFDMRLKQLLLENPKWTCRGRDGNDEDEDDDDDDEDADADTIFIENCEEENVSDRLEDPRYEIYSSFHTNKVWVGDDLCTYKSAVYLHLDFKENDSDKDDDDDKEDDDDDDKEE